MASGEANKPKMEDFLFIELNNVGVAHVMNGDVTVALQYFRAAFERAKRLCQVPASSISNNNTGNNHAAPGDCTNVVSEDSSVWWPLPSRPEMIGNLRSMASNDSRQHVFLIPHPVFSSRQGGNSFSGTTSVGTRLSSFSTYSNSESSQDMTMAAAFIIYNLAIGYSILGTWNSNDEKLLCKAKTLLENCRLLLLTQCRSIPFTQTPLPTGNLQVDLLWIMTLAKLAEINYVLSNFEHTRIPAAQLYDFIGFIRLVPEYIKDREARELLEADCQRYLILSNRSTSVPSFAPAA